MTASPEARETALLAAQAAADKLATEFHHDVARRDLGRGRSRVVPDGLLPRPDRIGTRRTHVSRCGSGSC